MKCTIKSNLLTLSLPSNSRNFTIPSRFCDLAAVGGCVSEDPFVSALFDIVVFGVSAASVVCKIFRLVAACLNSLFNWNNEKFRRLFVTNLKTFSMFQLYIGIVKIYSLCVVFFLLRLI